MRTTNTQRKLLHFAIAVLAALALSSAASAAQARKLEPAKQPAGAGSRQVALYVTVEKGDKLIGGLTERNFHLFEEGEPRDFELQEPEKPASIALLVEYSRSSWLYLRDIVSAMQGFVSAAPEGNWYALATFAHELNIAVDFTKQRGEVSQAFSSLTPPLWNEVDTYDAVYNMLNIMDRLPGRRILIVIGSGFDSFSSHTLDDVQKKIESANVTVFTIGAGSMLRTYYDRYLSSTQRLDLMQAQNFLQMLADKSGGWAVFPRAEAAFPNVMKGVMQSIEFQYKLVYSSRLPRDGKFHEIEVRAFQIVDDQREDFKVRAREGWRF